MTNKEKELYRLAVGEMGIAPSEFKTMTEEEITLAYEGFLKNKANQFNLLLLVLKKYREEDFSEISFFEQSGVQVSTKEEREKTFQDLNI